MQHSWSTILETVLGLGRWQTNFLDRLTSLLRGDDSPQIRRDQWFKENFGGDAARGIAIAVALGLFCWVGLGVLIFLLLT